jgi:hypothetical protein
LLIVVFEYAFVARADGCLKQLAFRFGISCSNLSLTPMANNDRAEMHGRN